MKKKLLSILLSIVMVMTMVSGYPLNIKADNTSTQTTSVKYSSTTDPGGAASIKEWKDNTNDCDLNAGWYHFTGVETNWRTIELYIPYGVSDFDDYDYSTVLYSIELWQKTGSSYQKINAIDCNRGTAEFHFHMTKGTEYYIYMGGVDGCRTNMNIQSAANIYDTFSGVDVPAKSSSLSTSSQAKVSVTSSDDIKWLKFAASKEGRYKITYPDSKNVARVDLLLLTNNKLEYYRGKEVMRDGVIYYDLQEGDVCYLACTSFEGAASYTVSIKKITQTNTYVNKDHTLAIRKSTKASAIANAQAKTSIDYLNKQYVNKSFAKRIDHVLDSDVAAFKKMAGIITTGCTTDKQKVDAIAKWVKNNITYDTNASSYSDAVFLTRKGDCQGMSYLIADFCKALDIPAAYVSGWKADLTKWSVDDLYHSYDRHNFAGHGWDMIYFDGKWHMYDILFDNLNVTDSATMAKSGYFFSLVEGISIVGDGVDPALIGYEDSYGRTITAAYYNDQFVTLYGGLICNRDNDINVDQDGDICSSTYESSSVGLWNIYLEDQYFPTFTSFYDLYPYGAGIRRHDGINYDDGRSHPESGYNYVDGWINNGKYLADPDGVLRNTDVDTINGKTYYFPQSGSAQVLNMNANDYYLYAGELYVKTGATMSLVQADAEKYVNDPNCEFTYEFIQAYDTKGNEVKGESLVKLDKGNITTLKPGYVWFLVYVNDKKDSSNITNYSVMLNITNSDKTAYSFKNSSTTSDPKDDDNKKDDDQPNVTTKTVKKVSLSMTSYVYNGKVKNPTVKAYDSDNALIPSSCYTISKSSGRKYVGKYKYTITFKNGYAGKKTLYFTIKPKATSITSVTSATKAFTVKWKKISTQATGYQIRYSTKSSMSGAKTVTATSYKTISRKVSGLLKKKKYYVQVRTYKTVSGVKYYSSWSGKRSVTTK